jgi:hypothetical protein
MSFNNEIILELLAQNNRVLANNEKIISMLQSPNQSFINSIPNTNTNTDIKQLETDTSCSSNDETISVSSEPVSSEIISISSESVSSESVSIEIISISSEEFNDDDSIVSELSCDVTDDNTDTNSEFSNYTTSSSYTETTYYTTTTSSSYTESRSRKKQKKVFEFDIITEEKNSYSPEDIENMTDCELLIHFMRITQKHKLYCSHCHRNKSLDYWIHSIRKRCMKKDGLCSEMKLPKTCDHQQAVNSISNTINNKVYRTLRDPKTSNRHKQQIMQAKAEFFEKLDKEVRPYKY